MLSPIAVRPPAVVAVAVVMPAAMGVVTVAVSAVVTAVSGLPCPGVSWQRWVRLRLQPLPQRPRRQPLRLLLPPSPRSPVAPVAGAPPPADASAGRCGLHAAAGEIHQQQPAAQIRPLRCVEAWCAGFRLVVGPLVRLPFA